jgi:hypothetical protein
LGKRSGDKNLRFQVQPLYKLSGVDTTGLKGASTARWSTVGGRNWHIPCLEGEWRGGFLVSTDEKMSGLWALQRPILDAFFDRVL